MTNEVATRTAKPGLIEIFAMRQNIKPENVMPVLMDTIIPNGKASSEQVQVFLAVCNEYELNPFTKEIYAFPTKGGGIQPIVGVDGWVKIIHREEKLDGVEFTEESDESGAPTKTTCNIYRKGMSRPITITEYFAECRRNTDPWRQSPRRMLRHKALIQCARVAFGIAGIVDEDEGERMKEVGAIVVDTEPSKTSQRVASKLASRRQAQKPQDEEQEIKNDEPQEVEANEVIVEEEKKHETPKREPDAYSQLYDLCADYQDEVDAALQSVQMPPMSDIIKADMTAADNNKCKRALKKVLDALSN